MGANWECVDRGGAKGAVSCGRPETRPAVAPVGGGEISRPILVGTVFAAGVHRQDRTQLLHDRSAEIGSRHVTHRVL